MGVVAATLTVESLVAGAFARGLRPEPELSVSQWADQYRIVGKPSPEPGPWSTARVPYAREIMDALSPSSPVEIVALMKAAQGAGTEVGLNAIGCWMHLYPDSTMIVQPTVDSAKKFSRIRLERMFEATPALRDIVAEPRSRNSSNTISLKEFGPARDTLVITGANSAVGLRSYPSRYVLADEIDGYPPDVDGEGDPIDLVMQRTGAFRNRKLFLLSTPTVEAVSNINRWWLAGDQRKFHVPCPLCGVRQPLVWGAGLEVGGLRWPKGDPDKALYECVSCAGRWPEWRKVDMLPEGVWVPALPGNGGGKIRSYHINALYYPYGWPENAWPNLAARWDRDHRDPVRLKTFVNLKLGEPWRDPSEAKADAEMLLVRRESYGPELPAGVAILTAGVDVQANRLEVEIVGWGKGEESWSIDYRVLLGDTAQPAVWAELDALLQLEAMSELGLSLSIRAVWVDSGYQTEIVTRFCGERFRRNVWAIKGKSGPGKVWGQKPKRQRGQYPPPFTVHVDAAKEAIYSRLKIETPGPGFCHFPNERDKVYFDQLTSEVRIPDYSGPAPKFVWRKKAAGDRNEAFDCRVYNLAALKGLESSTAFRLDAEADALVQIAEARAKRAKQLQEAAVTPAREPEPNRPSEPDWFDRGDRGDRGEWF